MTIIDPKVKEAFSKVKKDIFVINKNLLDLRDGQIKIVDSINELTEFTKQMNEGIKLLHQQLHAVTARSTAHNNQKTPLKSMQKRTLKELDKVQLMKAIKHYIDEGYKTNQIRDEIMVRFNIKERCFFKYLKLLHQQLHAVTARSTAQDNKVQ